MPGLIGFTDKHHYYNCDVLLNMRSLLKYFDDYVDEELYSDENVYASRTHLGIINQGKQPYIVNEHIFSWMEGEFYNQKELTSKYNVVAETNNELLAHIYHSTRSFHFLTNIDGCYVAVLYDKNTHQLHLITDRYGFKFLYWGIIKDNLVWSSELKGFLGHIDFQPVINQQAVEKFFCIGYLLENRSWFEGIELVPPASVLTFNIKKSRVEIQTYWSWNEITPKREPVNEWEIAEELGHLFKDAVRKRVKISERIGVNLSGGLDSRAILAAVPEDYTPLHTFTFGQEGCDDIKIARKVAEIKRMKHHILTFTSHNWLLPRIPWVWKADGALNLLYMHGTIFYDVYKSYVDVRLNGFLGDAILGGSYISEDQSMEYKVRNRGRRFINQALIMAESRFINRRPFFDNDLMTLVLAIPERLRQDSYIYNKMLLHIFPEYYKRIPWQKTGCPISYPKQLVEIITFKNRLIRKLQRKSQWFGFHFPNLRHYTDYPSWIRQEPARSFFETVLLNKSALYPEYIDRNTIQTYVRNHMEGKSTHHKELGLALTFELWLQQVFETKYRNTIGGCDKVSKKS